MYQPLITIVLTTYNRAHLIGNTLDSILAQTYKSWECIIIDDNSIDNTKAIVNWYTEKESRIEYILKEKQINKGLPASRNIGIRKAKGRYLVFFDDDDIVHPQLIELCVGSFKEKDLDFVHYKKQSFEGEFNVVFSLYNSLENLIILKGTHYEKVILGNLPLASCTVVWKTKIFQENFFNEELMYAEEWECYSRILIENKLVGAYLKIPLYFNRKHLQSNTGEFWSNDFLRKESYIKAHILLLNILVENNKLNRKLKMFFLQKAYSLKSKKIIAPLLVHSLKYRVLFFIYPIKLSLYKMFK